MGNIKIGDKVQVIKEIILDPDGDKLIDLGVRLGDKGTVMAIEEPYEGEEYEIFVDIHDEYVMFVAEELQVLGD